MVRELLVPVVLQDKGLAADLEVFLDILEEAPHPSLAAAATAFPVARNGDCVRGTRSPMRMTDGPMCGLGGLMEM